MSDAKLDIVPGNPGLYSFRCPCGYDKRKVVETERFFSCERPVEPKVPACKLTHEFAPLKADMEKRQAEAEAKKFLAENDRKVAAAKAVLGVKEPVIPKELIDRVADMAKAIATETQSDVETKVIPMPVKRGPGRPRKENK